MTVRSWKELRSRNDCRLDFQRQHQFLAWQSNRVAVTYFCRCPTPVDSIHWFAQSLENTFWFLVEFQKSCKDKRKDVLFVGLSHKLKKKKIKKGQIKKGQIKKDRINKGKNNKGYINKGQINKDQINKGHINRGQIIKCQMKNKAKIKRPN